MDALLLAAGRGTRLGSITDNLPKCLVPIAGRPLLHYWLNQLSANKDINRIFVNLHYLGDQVRDFISASPLRDKVVLLEEKALLGTGGTLAGLIRDYSPFPQGLFVAHADNLSSFSLQDFLQRHASRPARCLATVMTFMSETPESCGILELDDEGVMVAMHEKVKNPPGNLASGAVFLFDAEALEAVKHFAHQTVIQSDAPFADGVFDLSRDFLPRLAGRLFTYLNTEYHRDIGSPESLLRAQNDALGLALH